jgi:hypothetical protein
MEARVVRAEALLAAGKTRAAQKLAAELLVDQPSGPYARRLRTIVEAP